MESVNKARGHLGGLVKNHPTRSDLHERARRDLAAANLEAVITRIVDKAPQLTAAQVTRLTALLSTAPRDAA